MEERKSNNRFADMGSVVIASLLAVALSANIPLIISIVWLGVGIRQWIVLSKWTRRYEEYKRRRDEIDRQFDESLGGSGLRFSSRMFSESLFLYTQ
jgi:NADH:ubiquinone oxidoreductase subunit 5 (subunit L)/multisubunit Na+/H+ antiporter MnhA subunit